MTSALSDTVVGSGSDKRWNAGREIIHGNGTREASPPQKTEAMCTLASQFEY